MKNTRFSILVSVLCLFASIGGWVQEVEAREAATISLGSHIFDPTQHAATRGGWTFVWLNFELQNRNVCDSGCWGLLDAATNLAIEVLDLKDATVQYIYEPKLVIGALIHHARKGGWKDEGNPIAIAGSVFTIDQVKTSNGWAWVPLSITWGLMPKFTKAIGKGSVQWYEPLCEVLDRVERAQGSVVSFQVIITLTGISGVKLRHKD